MNADINETLAVIYFRTTSNGDHRMRNLALAGIILAATLSGCAGTSRSEMRANRENVREQRQDVNDARRYGDRRDVREEKEELRDARQERREDRRNPD